MHLEKNQLQNSRISPTLHRLPLNTSFSPSCRARSHFTTTSMRPPGFPAEFRPKIDSSRKKVFQVFSPAWKRRAGRAENCWVHSLCSQNSPHSSVIAAIHPWELQGGPTVNVKNKLLNYSLHTELAIFSGSNPLQQSFPLLVFLNHPVGVWAYSWEQIYIAVWM